MSALYDYGPLDTYEIVWKSGHVEHIQAHQCIAPPPPSLSMFESGPPLDPVWMFHGEIEGRWKLLLMAADGELLSVRNVTHTQDAPSAPKSGDTNG